ncbi:MAG: ATP-binding cassette domain-containing protein, partial [Lachnospiraceae bacterium]|nr:ATP-binding cassette domain-containing protein [Lachnospiraceae bacterium]
MEILKIENVYKEYGNESNKVVALRDVNISINKGEFVAIVGFSGSGKTTLLNMMGALDRPSKGKIIISSKNIEQMTEDERVLFRRRNIGFVFQSYNLISDLTA